ncbi:hypothetical protein LCEOLIKB_00236 [Aeromonas hydrophila]
MLFNLISLIAHHNYNLTICATNNGIQDPVNYLLIS